MGFKSGVILGTISFNASGSAATGIGAGSYSGTVSIGNGSATAVTILGPANINATGSNNTAIGSTSNSGTVAIGNTSSTSVTVIGPVNINTTASANTAINSTSSNGTVSIGNTSSGAITIDCGTAGITVGTTANSHTSTFGSTSGTSTTTISCGTGGANFGTSANAHATIVGSTTAASTTTIQAPSAGVILTGVAGVAVSNRNYVTINTSTGAIGSDSAPLTSISITGDSGGALTGSAFTFTGGTTGLTFAGAGSTETLGGTLVVSNGGTGRATLTNHGVLVGAGTTAITQLAVGATNSVLQGSTGADPAFTTTPTVTSITLGAGSALSTFTDWTSWTPTAVGATTAGTTTYSLQYGVYSRIGNIVTVQFALVASAATGTGNLLIGGLPLTIFANSNYGPVGTILAEGLTFNAGGTSLCLFGLQNSTTAKIFGCGTGITGAFVAIANGFTLYGTLVYEV